MTQATLDTAKEFPVEAKEFAKRKDQKPKSVLTNADKRDLNLAVLTENTSVMNPIEYEQMKKMANEFWQSGALNDSFSNPQQVIMALAAGREMGMSFTESINGLYFVKGKLNIYGKATPAALRRSGWRIQFTDETPESCTATVTNVNTSEEITDTFTFQDAKDSGFVTDSYGKVKIGWREGANRKRKLRYGVLSQIIHTYLPEVIGAAAGIAEYSRDYIEAEETTRHTVKVDAKAELREAINA